MESRCRTITVPEFGRLVGISRNAAYQAVRRGEILAARIGKRLVIPLTEVDRVLKGECQERRQR